jgi:hypothetical protein
MGFEKTMVVFLQHIKEIPAPQPRRGSPAALRTLLVKAEDVFIAARFGSSQTPDRRLCCDRQTNAAKRDVSARPAGRHRDPVARAGGKATSSA